LAFKALSLWGILSHELFVSAVGTREASALIDAAFHFGSPRGSAVKAMAEVCPEREIETKKT